MTIFTIGTESKEQNSHEFQINKKKQSLKKQKGKGDFYKMNSKEFLIFIKAEMKNQNEVNLRYEDFSFVMQPSGKSIEIYSHGQTLADYSSFEEFLSNFLIKGHLFMDVIDDLDFDD